MAIKDRYFDPNWYYYKVILLCVFIFIDIIMNSFTQYLNFGSLGIQTLDPNSNCSIDNFDLCYAILFLQLGFQILMIFTLLSIFSQTFLFKNGILGAMCKQFVFTFIILFLYPIIYLAERFIRSTYLASNSNPNNELNVWTTPYYLVFYILKYIFAFIFYISFLNTSYELGKSRYYRIDPSYILPS